jgi:ketosteroid isomerase-like protein
VQSVTHPRAGGGGDTAPMQESPTEFVERAYEAINRRDLEAVLEMSDPELEFVSLIAEAEGATYKGHDSLRDWWYRVAESLGGIQFAPERVTDLDDHLALVKLRITGEAAGVEVSQEIWQGIEIRDGLGIWWQAFRTEEEALEALEARRG